MYTVLLVIHVIVTLALILTILVQRNAGDMGSLSGSSSTSFMSGRAAASFVTRATAILATIFIFLSLGLGILAMQNHAHHGSIMDKLNAPAATGASPAATAPSGAAPTTAPVTAPAKPAVPRPE